MIKKISTVLIVLALLAVGFAFFQSKPVNVDNSSTINADVNTRTNTPATVNNQQLKEHYVKLAHAMYKDSLDTAKALQVAIQKFLAAPSEDALNQAKNAYKLARVPYQQSEILRWDSDITIDKNLDADGGPASVDDWEGQVNAWPLDEGLIDYVAGDAKGALNAIAGKEPITLDYLKSLNGLNDNEANVATGVHAIEFLLWGQDLNGTQAGAGQRPVSDYLTGNACTNGNCERRREYLKQVTQLLVDDLTEMTNEWSPEAASKSGTLANNFLNSELALDYVITAMRAMATDELASARMAAAFEHNDPEEEHDCFSDLSHVAIYNNFVGVKNAFYGTYKNISGPSLADLIKQKDMNTFTSFDKALNEIQSKMDLLNEAAERAQNTVRFDQLLAQATGTAERAIAEQAIKQLVGLNLEFNQIQNLLSLQELSTDGSGDGD